MGRSRLYEIDRAKGLAIILVIVGHVASPGQAGSPDWYQGLRQAIYLFHMPLFMALSGMIFQYSYTPSKNFADYAGFVRSKAFRLLPAFLIFGVITMLGKLLANQVLYVENMPVDFIGSLIKILIAPLNSPAKSLWFIYVLFQFYVLFPLLFLLFRNNAWVVFLFCIILYLICSFSFLRNVDLFAVNLAMQFALFFSAGILISRSYDKYLKTVGRYWWQFIALFLLSFVSILFLRYDLPKAIVGLCSIPAIHALVTAAPLKDSRFLLLTGAYTFSIYLMNMIIIGVIKGVTFALVGSSSFVFEIYFIAVLIGGLLGPIAIKKYIFPFIPFMNKITD